MSKRVKTCERLPLTTPTKRRLWGECGGYCQNPECAVFLFSEEDIDFAEMAHIIAASEGGPRDVPTVQMSPEQRASHENIAVLCANCHTRVDKAPDVFPIDMLKSWKQRSVQATVTALGTPEFTSRAQARIYVRQRLDENRAIFSLYGPSQSEQGEAHAAQWRRHVIGSVIPNNSQVQRALTRNRGLLNAKEQVTADLFAVHVMEFSARHVLGDWTAGGARFPDAMDSILEEEDK